MRWRLIAACLLLLPTAGEEARAATLIAEVSEAVSTVSGTLVFQSARPSGTTSRSIFDALGTDILDFGVGLVGGEGFVLATSRQDARLTFDNLGSSVPLLVTISYDLGADQQSTGRGGLLGGSAFLSSDFGLSLSAFPSGSSKLVGVFEFILPAEELRSLDATAFLQIGSSDEGSGIVAGAAGRIRLESVTTVPQPTPVPLPSAALLLLGAVGSLGAAGMSRRARVGAAASKSLG